MSMTICLGAGEKAPKTKIVLRTVKGAQAQGARERCVQAIVIDTGRAIVH
jgi:hypothetical protein